jgi:hypothetical protein
MNRSYSREERLSHAEEEIQIDATLQDEVVKCLKTWNG